MARFMTSEGNLLISIPCIKKKKKNFIKNSCVHSCVFKVQGNNFSIFNLMVTLINNYSA